MRSPSLLGLRTLHPRHWNLRLLWDLFMVWVALVNLGMILFDLTYLLLRPTYFRYTRVVTTVYDRVKGIEPHPLTDELLEEATQARDLLALDPASPGLAERVARLRELSLRVLEENPFERSGQTHNLEILKVMVGQQVGASTRELGRADALAAAVERFWSREPAALARSLQLFDARMRPLLEVNYFREFDLDGKLVDHFWLLAYHLS